MLLPLLPGVIEIFRRSDISALKIWQQHSNRPQSFAINFASKVNEIINHNRHGSIKDGEPYQIIGNLKRHLIRSDLPGIALIEDNATIDRYVNASHEIYVNGNLICKGNNILRALFVEHQLHLGENTSLLRWVHAKNIYVEKHSRLQGRVTADENIYFNGNAQFSYLHAEQIHFGVVKDVSRFATKEISLSQLAKFNRVPYQIQSNRLIIFGDCLIPENRYVRGDIVVHGKLKVMSGAHIDGNIKAHKNIYLLPSVIVQGAITGKTNTYVHANCSINGPLVTEIKLSIDSNSIIGCRGQKTSVAADLIKIKHSCLIYGTLRAKKIAIYKA